MSAFQMPDVDVSTDLVLHESNTGISRSPFSGATQRKVRDGERLKIQVGVQNLEGADRRKWISFLSRLNGAENQAIVRDRIYEKPSGSLSSIAELVDISFNSTNWETANSARGTLSEVSEGVRFTVGSDQSGTVLRPTTSADGISAPTAGLSYAAVIHSSDGRKGFANNAVCAARIGLRSAAGGILKETANTTEAARLVVAATAISASDLYVRPVGDGSSADFRSSIDLSQLSVARCLLVDNGFNALTYSEQFDNAAWTKTRSTVSANATAAPDGATTADELVEDSTASSTHFATQSYTRASVAEFWTGTVFIKENTSRRIRLWVDDGSSNGANAYFDANTGTITGAINLQGSGLLGFASIDAYDDGFYRCRVTVFLPASTAARMIVYLCDGANNTTSFNGDGTSGLYLWGAQLQRGGQPGRYVQTTGVVSTGGNQVGREVRIKALNRDEKQQMLAGDQLEINGQLCILSEDLDGDESGCGIARLTTSIRTAPADEDAVILYKPHGTFLLESPSNGWANKPGGFSDSSLSFVEDIAA